MRDITVVGASLAGLSAARALREQAFDGRIVVVGEEKHAPYDRPPLSKEFLAGTASEVDISLVEPDDADLEVEWRLGRTATALDTTERVVVLDDGERLASDAACWQPEPGPASWVAKRRLAYTHSVRSTTHARSSPTSFPAPASSSSVLGSSVPKSPPRRPGSASRSMSSRLRRCPSTVPSAPRWAKAALSSTRPTGCACTVESGCPDWSDPRG